MTHEKVRQCKITTAGCSVFFRVSPSRPDADLGHRRRSNTKTSSSNDIAAFFDTEPSASVSQHFKSNTRRKQAEGGENSEEEKNKATVGFDMLISFTSHLGSWVWWSTAVTETGLISRGVGMRAQVWFILTTVGKSSSSATFRITGWFLHCLGHIH